MTDTDTTIITKLDDKHYRCACGATGVIQNIEKHLKTPSHQKKLEIGLIRDQKRQDGILVDKTCPKCGSVRKGVKHTVDDICKKCQDNEYYKDYCNYHDCRYHETCPRCDYIERMGWG